MKVITAPDALPNFDKPTVFLAGGITNCPDWQDEVIIYLAEYDHAILFNPRRKNFPIHDSNAANEQIEWEFNALNNCTIFSMWFCKGLSDQPICMYELGRHLAIREKEKRLDTVVIGVEDGYRRAMDVFIQTKLISPWIFVSQCSPKVHAKYILEALKKHGI